MSANQKPDYRPAFVTQQDGSSLANSNCRMASAAMGVDFETRGGKTSTGAKMRSYTDDQSGGTDSSDAKQAWSRGYGEALTVRDGGTFDDALADLRDWRAVHLDVWVAAVGEECVSGSGAYGHTVIVLPDYNGDGWAVGDPWCTGGFGRIPESKLRKGAETWGSEVYGRAADEPDYPTDGPGPRDPRVLAIVRRVVKRLMDAAYPGGPAGELRHADTGGGSILYTVTHPLEGMGGGTDMGIYWNPTQWNDPGIPLYLDSACTVKVTDTAPGGFLQSLGPVARQDGNGFDDVAYSVLVNTSNLRDDGQKTPAILWAKRSDLPDATNGPAQAWDDSLWALAHDVTGRWPAQDVEAAVAAALVVRDQEWIDGLTEVWPAGAVSLLDAS